MIRELKIGGTVILAISRHLILKILIIDASYFYKNNSEVKPTSFFPGTEQNEFLTSMSILSLWEALLECNRSDDTICNALWDETSLPKSSI